MSEIQRVRERQGVRAKKSKREPSRGGGRVRELDNEYTLSKREKQQVRRGRETETTSENEKE